MLKATVTKCSCGADTNAADGLCWDCHRKSNSEIKPQTDNKKFWNDDRIKLVRDMLAEGLTCSQIGARFKVSRNAVIGIVTRKKLMPATRVVLKRVHPATRTNQAKRAAKLRDGSASSAPSIAPVPLDVGRTHPVDAPPERRKHLVDLEADDCRWPIGEPGKPEFGFCDRKRVAGLPYCDCHTRLAFASRAAAPNLTAGGKIGASGYSATKNQKTASGDASEAQQSSVLVGQH